jgi:two-component system, NarL family, response regulator DesR
MERAGFRALLAVPLLREDRVLGALVVVDPGLAAAALSDGASPLSARERDVLVAARDGATIAAIAATLSLSDGTVRNYLSTAIQKLGAQTRAEAARLAEQKGWL